MQAGTHSPGSSRRARRLRYPGLSSRERRREGLSLLCLSDTRRWRSVLTRANGVAWPGPIGWLRGRRRTFSVRCDRHRSVHAARHAMQDSSSTLSGGPRKTRSRADSQSSVQFAGSGRRRSTSRRNSAAGRRGRGGRASGAGGRGAGGQIPKICALRPPRSSRATSRRLAVNPPTRPRLTIYL